MSDPGIAKALTNTSKTNALALAALKSSDIHPNPLIAEASVLHADFVSIASLIYSHTTRLSLALGKQPPTIPAAIATLGTLSEQVNSLASCALAFHADLHGKTLSKEVQRSAEEIIETFSALVKGFIQQPTSSSYLQRTGATHAACDKAKLVSGTNREAVSKRIESNIDALQDAVTELEELTGGGDSKSNDEGDEDDDDDGGWGELGIDVKAGVLTESELATAKEVLQLLQTVNRLLCNVRDSLSTAGPLPVWASHATSLDDLLDETNHITKFADDLVSSLDAPIDVPAMKDALKEIRTSLNQVNGVLGEIQGEVGRVTVKMSTLQLQSDPKQDSLPVMLQQSLTIIDGIVK